MTFTRPPPRPPLVPSKGFTAGVITTTWSGDSYEIAGRGRVYAAEIAVDARHSLPRDPAVQSLTGLVFGNQHGDRRDIRRGRREWCFLPGFDGAGR